MLNFELFKSYEQKEPDKLTSYGDTVIGKLQGGRDKYHDRTCFATLPHALPADPNQVAAAFEATSALQSKACSHHISGSTSCVVIHDGNISKGRGRFYVGYQGDSLAYFIPCLATGQPLGIYRLNEHLHNSNEPREAVFAFPGTEVKENVQPLYLGGKINMTRGMGCSEIKGFSNELDLQIIDVTMPKDCVPLVIVACDGLILSEHQILSCVKKHFRNTEASLQETNQQLMALAYNCSTPKSDNITVILSKLSLNPQIFGMFDGNGRDGDEVAEILALNFVKNFKSELGKHAAAASPSSAAPSSAAVPLAASPAPAPTSASHPKKEWGTQDAAFVFSEEEYKRVLPSELKTLKIGLYNDVGLGWILMPKVFSRITIDSVGNGKMFVLSSVTPYSVHDKNQRDQKSNPKPKHIHDAELDITTTVFIEPEYKSNTDTQACLRLSSAALKTLAHQKREALQFSTRQGKELLKESFKLRKNPISAIQQVCKTIARQTLSSSWLSFLSPAQGAEVINHVDLRLNNTHKRMLTPSPATPEAKVINPREYLRRQWGEVKNTKLLSFYSYLLDVDYRPFLAPNKPEFDLIAEQLMQYRKLCFCEPMHKRLFQVKLIKYFLTTHYGTIHNALAKVPGQQDALRDVYDKLINEELFLQFSPLKADPNIPDVLSTPHDFPMEKRSSLKDWVKQNPGKTAAVAVCTVAGLVVPPAVAGLIGLAGTGVTAGVAGVCGVVVKRKAVAKDKAYRELMQAFTASCPMILGISGSQPDEVQVLVDRPPTVARLQESPRVGVTSIVTLREDVASPGDTKSERKETDKLKSYMRRDPQGRKKSIERLYPAIFDEIRNYFTQQDSISAEAQYPQLLEVFFADSAFEGFIAENPKAQAEFITLLNEIEPKYDGIWPLAELYFKNLRPVVSFDPPGQVSEGPTP